MSNDNRPIIIQQVQSQQPKWNKGIAALLSFLIPGAGQIYRGKIITGIVWFVLTLAGYAALVIPGLVLHFMCIIAASMGDPNR